MLERERRVELWFEMWLRQRDLGMDDLFTEDAVYIESWGPHYQGLAKIKLWFEEWNRRGRVLAWDIKQYFHVGNQTVVEWYFENRMEDGKVEAFDGLSPIRWSDGGKICFLQEFGCNTNRYDPYEGGPEPQFRQEKALWF